MCLTPTCLHPFLRLQNVLIKRWIKTLRWKPSSNISLTVYKYSSQMRFRHIFPANKFPHFWALIWVEIFKRKFYFSLRNVPRLHTVYQICNNSNFFRNFSRSLHFSFWLTWQAPEFDNLRLAKLLCFFPSKEDFWCLSYYVGESISDDNEMIIYFVRK
jgi:hypothetical protein